VENMIMKKQELLKLGLDEETAKKVEGAIAEILKNYIPKSRFDEVNAKKNKLQKELEKVSKSKTYAVEIKVLKIIAD